MEPQRRIVAHRKIRGHYTRFGCPSAMEVSAWPGQSRALAPKAKFQAPAAIFALAMIPGKDEKRGISSEKGCGLEAVRTPVILDNGIAKGAWSAQSCQRGFGLRLSESRQFDIEHLGLAHDGEQPFRRPSDFKPPPSPCPVGSRMACLQPVTVKRALSRPCLQLFHQHRTRWPQAVRFPFSGCQTLCDFGVGLQAARRGHGRKEPVQFFVDCDVPQPARNSGEKSRRATMNSHHLFSNSRRIPSEIDQADADAQGKQPGRKNRLTRMGERHDVVDVLRVAQPKTR